MILNHGIKSFAATPYWIKAPNNTNAAEDETVRFECEASGEPEPSVQWFVNGKQLSSQY